MQPTPQGLDTMNDAGLKKTLKEFLQQKRYVIVLDDIWTTDAWDSLKYALPDSSCGSMIMITTRVVEVALYCIEFYGSVYNLNPLPPDEAWILFCRKAFRSNSCPSQLVLLSKNIFSRCNALPLAIVAIGGLLSTKNRSELEWRRVLHSLGAELESSQSLESMRKILLLSYNDLPYYLKSCFLYLGVFPEDCLIKQTLLIRLWVAEGLVEEKQGITREEVAECYLNELYNRSLINEEYFDDFFTFVKAWQVHDLIREIILLKSRDQNFATVIVEEEPLRLPQKIRRLSIHKSNESILQMQSKSDSFYCIRSLLVFDHDTSLCVLLEHSRWLRVLDLTGAPLEVFPGELVNLFHLRFLSLRGTKIKKLPKSIRKLQNLETLDLKNTYVSDLPAEIIELQRLRHLLAYYMDNIRGTVYNFRIGCKGPRGIGSLVSLRTLTAIGVTQGSGVIRESGKLTQLRKLEITDLSTKDGILLCASIDKMSNLRYLRIIATHKDAFVDIQSISSPPLLLRRLNVNGRLEKLPHCLPPLHNLVKKTFGLSRLSVDPLEALQTSPNLAYLFLFHAFDGEELCIQAGGFQRLKVLHLSNLDGLRVVRVEKGAMPHLDRLSIDHCTLLEKVPLGIEDLDNLKELRFYKMPNEFEMKLVRNGGQDHWRVAHIPIVYFVNWRDGEWKRNPL